MGLVLIEAEALTLRRVKCGTGFSYRRPDGRVLSDAREVARLRSLAVPPAYTDVRYAADRAAHLQAVGTDAAGRLQYRYHPSWTDVREALKARRLAGLARSLPGISRGVTRSLACDDCTSEFATAAVVHLVSLTAIRAGGEAYAKERGTRGATTLLKSNVRIDGTTIALKFKAKGGKAVSKEVSDAKLAAALTRLLALPGRRLFQYRGQDGALHSVRAGDVNAYLRNVAGRKLSLKDFRTLVASAGALEVLASQPPGTSQRARKAQLREALAEVAEELTNTPTVCRKSYVHAAVVTAFEEGKLARLRKLPRSPLKKAELLARLVAAGAK